MTQIEEQFRTLPASIGGASFEVEASKQEMGRRRALQEYPNTDFVTEQDLGAQADDFTISGHIAGADYLRKKKALQDVFRSVGPFLLVHPFEGRFLVKIEGRLSIDESVRKLGWADISFKCKRATRDDVNRVTADPRVAVTAAVTAARAATVATAAAQSSRLSVASVRAAFREKLTIVQTTLANSVGTVLDVSDEVGAAVVASVDELVTVADSLITSSTSLFETVARTTRGVMKAPFVVQTTAEGVFDTITDGDRILAMLGIGGRFVRIDEVEVEPVYPACLSGEPTTTETDDDAATRNAQALTVCIRGEALASIVESILDTPPESTSQAAEVLEMITRLLLGQSDGDPDAMLYAVDAASMAALSDLRAAASSYLSGLANLPTIETYVVPSETNALLLAQELLGDATRFQEIIDRNRLSDPLYVPAGATIEYLRAA